MENPQPGWFADPDEPTRLRWWDGSAWTEHRAEVPAAPARRRPPVLLLIAVAAVLIIAVIRQDLLGAIALVAVAAVILGIIVLARGPIRRIPLQSRGAGAITAAAGVLGLMLSGGVAAVANAPDPSPVAFVGTVNETPSPTPARPTPTPTVTVTQEVVTEPILFTSTTRNDDSLDVGTTAIVVPGVNGERTITYTVTSRNGSVIDRTIASDVVSTPPVEQVTAVGTRQPPPAAFVGPACDPNYEGACVPIASDVDCAGGSGNGPAYVTGPVRVVGSDIYELDREGDGIACD